MAQALEFIRSLSFGSLVTNSLLLSLYFYYPHSFPPGLSIKMILAFGTLTGTLLHRVLNVVIFNPLTKQASKSTLFYTKLYELNVLLRSGLISRKDYNKYSSALKDRYLQPEPTLPEDVRKDREGIEQREKEEIKRMMEANYYERYVKGKYDIDQGIEAEEKDIVRREGDRKEHS